MNALTKKKQRIVNSINGFLGRTSVLILLVLAIATVFLIYKKSLPKRYDLHRGEIADVDIVAQRSVVDKQATLKRAQRAKNRVGDVMKRSEKLSNDYFEKLYAYMNGLSKLRLQYSKDERFEKEAEADEDINVDPSSIRDLKKLDEGVLSAEDRRDFVSKILKYSEDDYAFSISEEAAEAIAGLPNSVFHVFCDRVLLSAQMILREPLDSKNLKAQIDAEQAHLNDVMNAYKTEFLYSIEILRAFLGSNMEFDEEATRLAREAAVAEVQANPVMIQRGSKIVLSGDVIDADRYELLLRLDLINRGEIDYDFLAGELGLVILILFCAVVYTKNCERSLYESRKSCVAVALSAFIVILATYYLLDAYSMILLIPFFTVSISSFYEFRSGFVFSALLSALLSLMRIGDMGYFVCLLMTSFVCASVVASSRYSANYLKIILSTLLASASCTLFVELILKSTANNLLRSCAEAGFTSSFAAIAAVGFLPVQETLESKVSPVKLTALAHPSNPLLRRLFLEAPGTNQHSMMVANLAEAGAEAVGADALLCRVASYYHDVGKLYNPSMFTENQEGINPHDKLSPRESYEAIIKHVEEGINIARRYRLPEAIQDIIREHHGTTILYYFYAKACKEAEARGEKPPSQEEFRYPYRIPQTKESGIIMLADTVEAAVKSMRIDHLDKMRELSRNLLRQKNEQEQLIESKLSYAEVETILEAFARVYQGQFHERVKYPDQNKNI
ncbi:MAG: HDIG domain-containing protein [Eubacteriales bacterium]|nr:HDIG domain-containing protein [Eubacteriales bacterium]